MAQRVDTFAIGAAAAVLVAAAHPAAAQEQSTESGGLEEITVTATRRGETDLQKTPVAVTAVDREQLASFVPRDISEVAAVVPNFSASRITAFNAASFSIRGAAQTDIIVYQEPPVAVLVDDFVVSSVQTQLLDPFDLEQMEVLRGPQGTLFGKNTTGGAVIVRTRRPRLGETSGEMQVGFGSFGRVEGQAAANLSASDRLALRLVGKYSKTDGYYSNGASFGPTVAAIPEFVGLTGSGDGNDAGGYDVLNGRIKALWQVTDTFSALLQYEILRDDSDSVPAFNDTPAEPGCVPFVTCQFVWNSLGLTRDEGDPIDRVATTNRNGAGLGIGDGQTIDVDGVYLNLEGLMGNGWAFNSVTGYREQNSRLPNTYTGEVGPVSLFDAKRDDDRETFQHEMRLSSSTDRASWVLGAFYQQEDVTFCVLQVLGFLDMLGTGQAAFGVPDFFNNNPQVLCNAQEAEVIAGFADATFNLTDRFSISLGARLTNEQKEWTGRNQVFIQALGGGFDPTFTIDQLGEPLNAADFNRFPTGVVRSEEEWTEPTWRATGSFAFNPDVFGYATLARGFKSGGYNDQTGTTGTPITAEQARPTDPEFATSLEVGLKSELLDNRLRLNAAVFYVEYTDAQRAVVATTAQFQETRFFNAADVTVKGVELEATAQLTDRFLMGLSAGYQDGEYDKFEADADFSGSIEPNEVFTGLPVTRTPEFQGSLLLAYDHPAGALGSLRWTALFQHEDANIFILSDVGPQFHGVLDAKDLLQANVTFTSADESWFMRLYGKNLTDERYRVAVQPVANLWTHAQFGEPRSWGIEAGIRFGD